MLDDSLKEQVCGVFSSLESEYVFDAVLPPASEEGRILADLLDETASCSDKISCRLRDGEPLSFSILKNGKETGVSFRGIPSGHEYTSLLLAVLNADGKGRNLPDDVLLARAAGLRGNIAVTTYVSLDCTKCPDVVQALDIMALYNPRLSHQMVDGALFPEEVERLSVQGVPTVFANGELLHVGRATFGELLGKLEARFGLKDDGAGGDFARRDFDVLVVGGGPAGVSAAVYSARKGLSVAVVCGRIGGQVNETVDIENLVTLAHTTGRELASSFRDLLARCGVAVFENREAVSFDVSPSGIKSVAVKNGEVFSAPAVVAACGASWKKLNIPGEEKYMGRGVAFCPHCDGPFYKDRDVAVVGGGNSGVEAAIDLAGICRRVTVIEFLDELKADAVLQQRLASLPNVEVITGTKTLEVSGERGKVVALLLENRATGATSRLNVNGVFVQIGLKANGELFAGATEVNGAGEIVVDRNCRTSVPGLYAAGDVTDVAYKQIAISVGEGAKAALSAFDDRVRGVI